MIDNYDSFTYNLVQYLGELGEELVVKRNDSITIDEIEELSPDFLMISPGPCSPDEAGISLKQLNISQGKFLFSVYVSDISPSHKCSVVMLLGQNGLCTGKPRISSMTAKPFLKG